MTMYLDIHGIQTVPPSCMNRDDIGAPKTAIYGGVERARVSSQSWKHAMRDYFRIIFEKSQLGSRSKKIPMLIAQRIMEESSDFTEEKALKKAVDALKNVGIKLDDKKGETAALFFISAAQVDAIAKLVISGETDKTVYKQAMKDHPSADIALFGRMVADDASLNYDAASQVAHAISTHGVKTEYDYFTAVDDEKEEDQSGAGHLGTVEFNSSTLYRYATVNVSELVEQIGGKTVPSVIRGFVEAFACSMPSGKQNTFANRTVPDMLYVTVRTDQPVNLSGAFEKAVKNTGEGYSEESCHKLLAYAEKVYDSFADRPVLALGSGDKEILSGHADAMNIKELLSTLEKYVEDCIAKECR